MRNIIFVSALLGLLFLSCEKDLHLEVQKASLSKPDLGENSSGHIRIATISDIHYMHPSLVKNNAVQGSAFQLDRVNRHYALVEFSAPVLEEVVSEMLTEKPHIVLITGDLTKEGEKVGHMDVVARLQLLRASGIKVFVVPGHSDINNPNAKAYDGNSTSSVPTITPAEFSVMYADFGFSDAIARDAYSLSYVVEPFPGLWLLAIDDAKYSPVYNRGGRIKPETMLWIKSQMEKAREQHITVLGFMHHNLVQDFEGQDKVTPNFLIDDWKMRTDSLVKYGLQVVFTGHNHATDITMQSFNGSDLYDIQAGSCVTPPISYRLSELRNKELEVDTRYIRSIPAVIPGDMDFTDYARTDLSTLLEKWYREVVLIRSPYFLSNDLAKQVAPMATTAFMAYLGGDEKIPPVEQRKIDSLSFLSPQPEASIAALKSMWTDMNTKDVKWHIKLVDR